MEILPFLPSDLGHIPSLQPADWYDILPKIEYYTVARHCRPVKAVIDNTVAAIGCAIFHKRSAWLGHIIVNENHRGKGIGTAITQWLMQFALSQGYQTVQLVATDMGYPVYKKLGFRDVMQYAFFKDARPVDHYTMDEHIAPISGHHHKEIFALDLETNSDERTEELIPFLSTGFVYTKNNRNIEGFYLPSLGDGLIVAENETAGIALLNYHLQEHTYTVLPETNLAAVNCVLQHGGIQLRKASRMIYGEDLVVKFENMYNRIGGNKG